MRFLKIQNPKLPVLSKWLLVFSFFMGMVPFNASAQNDTSVDNHIYMIVPQMPTFREDLDTYLANHLQYPQSAIDKGIQGTVNITFVVTQTGEITDVTVLSGVSPDLDSEAVRIVNNMPPWNPGRKNGKAVKVQYNLPVYFQLSSVLNKQHHQGQENKKPTLNDTIFTSWAGLYLDPYFGAGIGGPQSSTPINISMNSNLKSGIGLSYLFPSNIGFSFGLQVQQYNFSYTYSKIESTTAYNGSGTTYSTISKDTTVTAGYTESIKYSFLYAQLPLLCRYVSSHENRVGFYAEAGAVVNYLMSSRITGTAIEIQYLLHQSADTYWYDYSSSYSDPQQLGTNSVNPAKLTISAHVAAGVLIPLSTDISLIFDVSSDIGLMNAGNGANDIASFGPSTLYIYGNGNFGSFNSYLFEAKLWVAISHSSKTVHKK